VSFTSFAVEKLLASSFGWEKLYPFASSFYLPTPVAPFYPSRRPQFMMEEATSFLLVAELFAVSALDLCCAFEISVFVKLYGECLSFALLFGTNLWAPHDTLSSLLLLYNGSDFL
jgi:hypothetical protein